MVVLDPFAAASKPMPNWDTIPSNPLRFAATLHDVDVNTHHATPSSVSSSQKLPRPRRPNDTLPASSSKPSAKHSKTHSWAASTSSHHGAVGSDEWMEEKVAQCVDNAKSDLIIQDFGLQSLSTKIADLRDLVTLSHVRSPTASPSFPRPTSPLSPSLGPASPFIRDLRSPTLHHLAPSDRGFSRTQSAPASAAFFTTLRQDDSSARPRPSNALLPAVAIQAPGSATQATTSAVRASALVPNGATSGRQFSRSKTGGVLRNQLRPDQRRSAPDIGVYASQNLLVSLPSALFDIRNLTVLSLRSNRLQSLPAAIGELRHLKELNISNNLIRYLPSTILDLSLEQFSAHPNRWMEAPVDAPKSAKSPAVGSRNSLITAPTRSLTQSGPVPTLAALCMTVLLSPRPPSNLPPLIDCYNWDECRVRGQHPLLDPHILSHSMPPSFGIDELGRILQSVKNACSSRAQAGRSTDPFPHSYRVPPPDDAAENPYFSPCPSPRHWTENDIIDNLNSQSRRIFLHAAEERFQWREVANVSNLPIRWLGCSPGCLEFLDDEDDEEEWPVDVVDDL